MQTKFKPLALVFALAANSHSVWAADNVQLLGEMVISATRTANNLDQVPASVSVVTKSDFEIQQAASVADVLKNQPGVDFPGGPRLNGEVPTIRGLKGKEITVLIDGARQNDYVRGGLMSQLYIDPYFLSRGEVLRGSGSSLYGPGGIGGVMSFTTLSALDLLSSGQTSGADAKVGFASADNAKNTNARVYGKSGSFDGVLALGHHEWQHIRQGGGTYQEPNDGNSDTGLVKIGMQQNNDLRFELSNEFYRSRTLEPINPLLDWTILPHTLQLQYNNISQAQTVLKANKTDEAGNSVISASVYNSDLKINSDPGPGTTNFINTETNTVGFSLQGSKNLDGGAARHRVSAGLDYYKDDQSAFGSGNANPNGNQAVYGLFVQDEIALGGSWQLTPSLRSDRYTTTPGSITSTVQTFAVPSSAASTSHTSPKLSLSWQATEALDLYGSYGQAFRAPTLNEMYMSTTVASCAALPGGKCFRQFSANPDLRPELDRTYEIGANYHHGQIFSGADSLRLRISLFDSKITNMISSIKIGPCAGAGCSQPGAAAGIYQSQNLQSANRTGGELELGYDSGAWRTNVGYSHVNIVNTTPGTTTPNPDSVPDKLSAQVRYKFAEPDVSVRWNTTAIAAQGYNSTLAARRSGYAVHDVFAQWELSKNSRVDFGVSNLFDKRYTAYNGSGLAQAYIYAAGRSVMASLSGSY